VIHGAFAGHINGLIKILGNKTLPSARRSPEKPPVSIGRVSSNCHISQSEYSHLFRSRSAGKPADTRVAIKDRRMHFKAIVLALSLYSLPLGIFAAPAAVPVFVKAAATEPLSEK